MDRETLQRQAAQLLSSDTRLLCQWATCTGKSKVALNFLQDNPGIECLILVPEQNNIQNWIKEFNKFCIDSSHVSIACYASFKKFKDTRWDLIVFDEVPHIDTQLRRDVCNTVTGTYILALGAVVDKSELSALEEAYGPFTQSVVSLKDAITWGIVPKPRVCVIHLELDNTKKLFYMQGQKCTTREKYAFIVSDINKAKEAFDANPNERARQMMLFHGNRRKRFLGQLKEDAVSALCRKIKEHGKRFLCFCASIKQAQRIGGSNAFTSKTPASEKKLERFNNHEIDSLFVVSKLIEGQNLVDIESGIITQLGGTPRITVQMIGRVLRSKNPIIYIPVFDDTKDDSFLWTVTANIPEDCIKHYNSKSLF